MLKLLFYPLLIGLTINCHILCATQLNEALSLDQDIHDTVITTKITAWYAKDKRLNPFKIFVSTQDGVVHLTGYVKNKQAYVDALRIAKSTHGVKEVNADNLEIKKINSLFADAYITAKVETAVLKAKVLDDESIPLVGINATTQNGIVTVTGELPSQKSAAALIKRISHIKGVKKIISHLKISESEK